MADVEMSIRLNDIHELFETSNYDAFDPYSLQVPGLELFSGFSDAQTNLVPLQSHRVHSR